ncbi:hypothetical protein [Paenibacillus ehimensis]|uniref:hypothetical protein n=1 Tax=Paenibacillus ehimensis TaxID=79264 RepID=UPI0013E38A67|nr:hypothetical protein [Paenibacillus ehimensis]
MTIVPFEEIWHADMNNGNGLLPLIKGVSDDEKNEQQGYVIVNQNPFPRGQKRERSQTRQVNVLEEVHIPDKKLESYSLFKKLHDNYDWRRNKNDETPQAELDEVNEFLNFAIKTAPMKIARDFAIDKGKISSTSSDEAWINELKSIWFNQYRRNSTSAFEHVFIGEQGEEGSLSGHHSWYHYHINDGPFEVTHQEDKIRFLEEVEVITSEKSRKAEIITIKYIYSASDENGRTDLMKSKGGFFVGLSTEGLLAMGTVGFLDPKQRAAIPFVLNGENYSMTVWKTQDNRQDPRTFFPKFAKQSQREREPHPVF